MKTIRTERFFILPLAICACLLAQTAPAADNPAPFPNPPMQGKPWTPPETKLPPVVVSAATALFDQGMADPRGCEYREVEIDCSTPSQRQTRKLHAWVIPGDDATRFAVGWNGRVISIAAVDGPADLQKDIATAIRGRGDRDDWELALYDFMPAPDDYSAPETTTHEYGSLSEKSIAPIKIAMLLRLGEARLAESIWKTGKQNTGDPYVDMAQEWLFCWFNQAIKDHESGSDARALQSFRALAAIEPKVETAAANRGPHGQDASKPFLYELRQVPELVADQERRAAEQPYTPATKAYIPDQSKRIAAFIHDLELAHGEQMMMPGETTFWAEPIVQSLIHEGEPAVEPLIDCLEEDPPRLTRTYYTAGGTQGPVEYAYEPAYVALISILNTTITVPWPVDISDRKLSLADRKALAAKFRAYWAKYKGMPMPERWYAALRDDHATPEEWLEAAANIVQPPTTTYERNMFSAWDMRFDDASFRDIRSPDAKMNGDSLRAKTDPTVTELLIKRFEQLLPVARPDNMITVEPSPDSDKNRMVNYTNMSKLLDVITDWDGKARLDDLKKLTAELNAKFPKVHDVYPDSDENNSEFFLKRAGMGDPAVFADYERWLDSLSPEATRNNYAPDVRIPGFDLLEAFPYEPAVRKIADKIFANPKSPWLPRTPAEHQGFSGLVRSSLLEIPAFRECVVRMLGDTGAMGYTRVVQGEDNLDVELNGRDPDPDRKLLTKIPFRVCDYYASELAEVYEFPAFQLNWPQPRRDAAIAACKTLLTRYGDALHYNTDPGITAMRIKLPRLDHPATAQDVAQGRAIFTLAGETRLVSMPALPLPAKRPASKNDPSVSFNTAVDGTTTRELTYNTEGTIWQAEEVKVDGQWRRFYGFSGRHQLEKVAADEIEFPGSFSSVPVSPSLDCDLTGLEGPPEGTVFPTGTPLPIALILHNNGGADRNIPGALLLPAGAGKTLPSAVTFVLLYSEKIPPKALMSREQIMQTAWYPETPFEYGKWDKLPLRKEIATASAQPDGPLIQAANAITLLQINLGDYFDTTRPGSYRLQAIYRLPGEKEALSEQASFIVAEKTK